MPRVLDPFRFLLLTMAGWMNQHQVQMMEYLREENRVLREPLGDRRLRFNEDLSDLILPLEKSPWSWLPKPCKLLKMQETFPAEEAPWTNLLPLRNEF